MAHKNLIGGTAYDTKGGKCMVNGTGYSIKKGRTLVGGTGYNISFSIQFKVKYLSYKTFDKRYVYGEAESGLTFRQYIDNIINTPPYPVPWLDYRRTGLGVYFTEDCGDFDTYHILIDTEGNRVSADDVIIPGHTYETIAKKT